MAQIIILSGGDSPEREISLQSGVSVANALQTAGHTVKILDPQNGLKPLLNDLKRCDVVFPALHGQGGEDGVTQKFLEKHKIPFVGSGSKASELCFDKYAYIESLDKEDVFMPLSAKIDKKHFGQTSIIEKPFVLKPIRGGSSIDTLIFRNPSNLDGEAINSALDKYKIMLIQELVIGTEITVAVLGDEALPVVEIIPPEGGEFDFENKYNGLTKEICPPISINLGLQHAAQSLALTVHKFMNCRDLSRTDIIVTPDGQLFVLETNTMPGLTDQSLLPRSAAEHGLSMPELCDKLVKFAMNRTKAK